MYPRRAISLAIALFASFPACVSAGDSDVIFIKSGAVHGRVALIEAERNGIPIELECITTESSCRVPKTGRYVVAESPNSIYEDCTNVDLSEIGTHGHRGGLVGTFCDLSGPGEFTTDTDRGLWSPPDIDLPDEHPESTVPREMIHRFQVGSTSIALNETTRAAAQKALGGTIGMKGDAGDWEAWLCYHGVSSNGGPWILWLLSSEVDNEKVDGFLWMRLSVGEPVDRRCKLIAGENAIKLPVALRLDISESEVRQVLGKPTLVSGNLLEYSHEHKQIINQIDYTVTNDVNLLLEKGRVRSIQVWRSAID